MDTNTALTVLGTAIGGAKLAEKLLGPTAEYLGGGMRNWTEKRVNNVKAIFASAGRKLGPRINDPGSVHPRVLQLVLDAGSYSDDALVAEYFGGVLASSRSGSSRDDRGVAIMTLLSRLSVYQIRSHFLFYNYLKTKFQNREFPIAQPNGRDAMKTFVDFNVWSQAMEFDSSENPSLILNHVGFGLVAEFLVENEWRSELTSDNQPKGVWFKPSGPGIHLFLCANGRGELPLGAFLTSQFEVAELDNLPRH
jgi:hypothetical protein